MAAAIIGSLRLGTVEHRRTYWRTTEKRPANVLLQGCLENRRALIPHRRYRNSTMSPDRATPEPAARTWYPNWYRSERISVHLERTEAGPKPRFRTQLDLV
jgi:hypothetical protein